MGNICSKASNPDTSTAGRRLGSAPTAAGATSTYGGAINPKPTASIPMSQKKPNAKPKVTGPGRTLGGPDSGGDSNRDAREAAARAAEAREQAAKAAGKGTLGSKLEAQKRQTKNQQIQELSQQKQTDSDTLAWN